MGKMFLITSGKGGTGKTVLAVNLAAMLAEDGSRVLLTDMNIGYRSADLFMGLENDVVYDSSDVLRGVCDIEQALVKDRRFENLYLLAAAPEHEDGVNIRKFETLLGLLQDEFDYVIVDMPTGVSRITSLLAKDAASVILVSTADPSSLRDTDALDRKLLSLGVDKQKIILNRLVPEFMNEGVVPKLRDIVGMLKPEIIGIVQEDIFIAVAGNLGVPVVMKRGTYIRRNFARMAGVLRDL